MADIRRDERDEDRRERRARRRDHSTRRERTHEFGDRDVIRVPEVEELRRARSDFYTSSGTSSRRTGTKVVRMPSASTSRVSLSSTKSGTRHKHKSRRKHSSRTEGSHGRRKSQSKDSRQKISTEEYVYKRGGETVTETRTTYIEKEDDDEDESTDEQTMSDIQEELESNEKVKVIYMEKKQPRSTRHSSTRHEERDRTKIGSLDHGLSSRKAVIKSESPVKRSSSTLRNPTDMLSLRRSHSVAPRSRPLSYPEANTSVPNRRSSVFAGFFNPQSSHQPVKLTECTVCLADDIPSSKNPKLKCGHRQCHSCLKRNFKLSITDPQHMPPKCCTSDHIPLHHVENLFDLTFKKTWNRKFQEYTTKNRLYCPGRRCGEWIKPANIQRDRDGKKYGVCSNCKMKVCFICNGKWHGHKDCPKDDETNQLLEAAKKAGWQRCFNCRALVELKEGCNHMTCRCRAEFCMICGLKWKTCNCPWFNYETVENDRLMHMQVLEDPFLVPNPPRQSRLRTYHDEISSRRRQERADEILARRFQGLGVLDRDRDDDYNGGIGDVMGIGNGAGHFMNDSFRRPGMGARVEYGLRERGTSPPFGRSALHPRLPSPPPRIRARDMIERYPPPDLPPMRREIIEEIILPAAPRDRRSRTRESSAARNPRTPERSRSRALREQERERTPSDRSPGSSVLAGLNTRGSGGGTNRVNAWRAHVEPGVTPDEGVLSM